MERPEMRCEGAAESFLDGHHRTGATFWHDNLIWNARLDQLPKFQERRLFPRSQRYFVYCASVWNVLLVPGNVFIVEIERSLKLK